MAMKEFAISVPNGMATTVLMSDEDAKRAGLLGDDGKVNAKADPAKQPDKTAAELAEEQSLAEKAEADARNQQFAPQNTSSTPATK